MKFKNVLIASDFDGTLKNDVGIITPDVIEKIQYFIKNGGFFTVCTGRIHQGFHLYSPEYINAPVLLGNGAMAYDYATKKLIFNDTIGEESFEAFAVCVLFSPTDAGTHQPPCGSCAPADRGQGLQRKGIFLWPAAPAVGLFQKNGHR
jgi:hypothetical protein